MIEVPDSCIVCYTPISHGNSVLLHCECVIAMCQNCAFAQICTQPYTYLRGLNCPCCRVASHNIIGIERCQIEEHKLVQSATKYFSKLKSKRDRNIRNLLKTAIKGGQQSTITEEDIKLISTGTLNLGPRLESSVIRLELARIEQRRLNREAGIRASKLPLGPLEHLKITRNVFLEAALQLQAKVKDLVCPLPLKCVGPDSCQDSPNTLNGNTLDTSPTRSAEEDSDSSDEGSIPKSHCVCGDEEAGFYVQCSVGAGGCNGWVHPECVPSLRGLSKDDLASLQNFICPLCQYHLEMRSKITQGSRVSINGGKYVGKSGLILSKQIGSTIKVQLDDVYGRVATISTRYMECEPSPPESNPTQAGRGLNNSTSEMKEKSQSSVVVEDLCMLPPPAAEGPEKLSQDRDGANTILTSSPITQVTIMSPPTCQFPRLFCVCDGGSECGRYIECESEGACKGPRFFHMKCVGVSETTPDSLKRRLSFICSACASNKPLNHKRFCPSTLAGLEASEHAPSEPVLVPPIAERKSTDASLVVTRPQPNYSSVPLIQTLALPKALALQPYLGAYGKEGRSNSYLPQRRNGGQPRTRHLIGRAKAALQRGQRGFPDTLCPPLLMNLPPCPKIPLPGSAP